MPQINASFFIGIFSPMQIGGVGRAASIAQDTSPSFAAKSRAKIAAP
jgi:hypothetical protein